ncbi:hypothetical protein N7366_15455 [Aeromonas caviae]|nr:MULTISPECIES: hypothetical protein [Aeromonas]MBL0587270.1 hypothetical protein [Aeromonas caviae]MDH0434619.1 hypothetical protein [Aeromonas caviae]MDH0937467.1 hypothetical protein [Aeromonas caviae]MDH1398278.1 hypothetical protein [Aeromonas caviae]MDH1805446.1 hypothetical protein [Aeromonas caviae]
MADEKEIAGKAKGKPRNVKNIIPVGDQEIAVYATPKVSKALGKVRTSP